MESLDVSIEKLGNLKLKLAITVPQAEVKGAYDKCYKSLKGDVRVNGFRKGKVPQSVMEKRFEKHMKQEALENLVPKYFDMALKQESLKPAANPKFDNLEVNKKKPLVFDATFEIWPDFDLPEASAFSLDKKEIVNSEEEIEKKRQEHLERWVTYIKKEGGAEEGEQVLIDFGVKIEGQDMAREENHEYVLGTKQFLPEVEEALLGMTAGDEKEFEVKLPEEHHEESLRGQNAKFDVQVKEVRSKVLPEINDELFGKYGDDVNNEEEFNAMLDKEVTEAKENENKVEYREALKKQLSGVLDFELPEDVYAQETQFQLEQAKRATAQAEDAEGNSDENAEEEAKAKAADSLRVTVYFERMLEKDELSVNEQEVNQRFAMNAQMMGMNPADLYKQQYGQHFYQEIYRSVVEETVLDYLTEQVLAA